MTGRSAYQPPESGTSTQQGHACHECQGYQGCGIDKLIVERPVVEIVEEVAHRGNTDKIPGDTDCDTRALQPMLARPERPYQQHNPGKQGRSIPGEDVGGDG